METKAVDVYKTGVWLMLLFVHGESQSNIQSTYIFIVALSINMQYEVRYFCISI